MSNKKFGKNAQRFPRNEVHVMQKRARNTSPHLWVQTGRGKNWKEIDWGTQVVERGVRGYEVFLLSSERQVAPGFVSPVHSHTVKFIVVLACSWACLCDQQNW